jgi:hypothetical protein
MRRPLRGTRRWAKEVQTESILQISVAKPVLQAASRAWGQGNKGTMPCPVVPLASMPVTPHVCLPARKPSPSHYLPGPSTSNRTMSA